VFDVHVEEVDVVLPLPSPSNPEETQSGPRAEIKNIDIQTYGSRELGEHGSTITLCVCAMWRTREKASVKSLIERLENRQITVISLDETILFDDDFVESFPKCDAIWTLYSPDLPLIKVEHYVQKTGCIELNSIAGLVALRDRREMFRLLVEYEIPVPFHIFCNRIEGEDKDHPDNCVVEEFDDYIVINGQKLSKPFLEKPADADNHEVYIYYPKSVGGGRTRLGKNMCGFDERGRIRRSGSFVYERFIPSEGFETRLFVISSVVCEKDNTYIFAEAKTSVPATAAIDGETRQMYRIQEGMENSVLANPAEKLVCPKIAKAFGQTTFKVDLLRSQTMTDSEEKFFVYDISVKGGALKNRGSVYYDGVAQALYNDICLRMNYTPFRFLGSQSPERGLSEALAMDSIHCNRLFPQPSESQSRPDDCGSETNKSCFQELLCVWCLVRHGDRTPKRKLKLKVPCDDPFTSGWLLGWLQGGESEEMLCEFFGKQRKNTKCAELRLSQQLNRLCLVLKECDKTFKRNSSKSCLAVEKQQSPPKEDPIKPLICSDNVSVLQSAIKVLESFLRTSAESPLLHAKVEVQDKNVKVTLKWGGELTQVGKKQAYDLGEHFRAEHFPFDDASHLHATLRHDVKVYASAEPRCRQTAGSFTKGFLSLSGPLPQIIVSFVRTDGLGRLTDAPFKHTPVYGEIKEVGRDLSICEPEALVADPKLYVRSHQAMQQIAEKYETIGTSVAALLELIDNFIIQVNQRSYTLSNLETTVLMSLRWYDLRQSLEEDHGTVGHCLDAALYDVRHNLSLIQDEPVRQSLLAIKNLALQLSEIIGPLEFGRTLEEKAKIGAHFVSPLIRKLRFDLRVASGSPLGRDEGALEKHNELYGGSHGWQPIRTRLYFAHNSHIQTLVNCLRFGNHLCKDGQRLNNIHFPSDLDRLGYCSHLTVKLWRVGSRDIAQIFLSVGDGKEGLEPKTDPPSQSVTGAGGGVGGPPCRACDPLEVGTETGIRDLSFAQGAGAGGGGEHTESRVHREHTRLERPGPIAASAAAGVEQGSEQQQQQQHGRRTTKRGNVCPTEKVNCSLLLGEVPLHELDLFFTQIIDDVAQDE